MITERRITSWLVLALAIAHIALATGYALLTPYRTPGYLFGQRGPGGGPASVPDIGAPDERQHVNYVLHLLRYREFPVLRPHVPSPSNPQELVRNPNLIEEYEAHQPPLYYVVAAGFSRFLGLSERDLEDPEAGGSIRLLNLLFGALTVVGVFSLAWWTTQRRGVALLATAIAALLPMHAALSGAASNDPLTFAICTWVLALCAKCIRVGWVPHRVIGMGVLIGLGLLTKSTALILLPVMLLAMLVSQTRPRIVAAALGFASALLIAYPWWMRNQTLYGDPLGLSTFKEAFADALPASIFSQAMGGPLPYWTDWVAWWTARSFFGVFGYMDVFLNETGTPSTRYFEAPNALYWVLAIAAAIAAVVGLASIVRERETATRRIHWVNATLLALVALFFVQYNLTYFQGQGRYFYPAVGPICVGLSLGVASLFRRGALWAGIVVVAGLLGLNLYALNRLPSEFEKRAGRLQAEPLGRLNPSLPIEGASGSRSGQPAL